MDEKISEKLKYLVSVADQFVFDPSAPLSDYINIVQQLDKLAIKNIINRQYELAFIAILRIIGIVVDSLKSHPDYGDITVEQQISLIRTVKKYTQISTNIKRILIDKYKSELKPNQVDLLIDTNYTNEYSDRKHVESPVSPKISTYSENVASLSSLFADYNQSTTQPLVNLNDRNFASPVQNMASSGLTQQQVQKQSQQLDEIEHFFSFQMNYSLEDEFYNKILTVVIPRTLVNSFIDRSKTCLSHNQESLGILAGIYRRNTNDFLLTNIIMPPQSGCSDSCKMLDEEELFEYQVNHELKTLGWIHTHPSQTSFLSSIDLHTQFSYQCLMASAVAIVFSGVEKLWRIFSLTKSGMEVIKNCRMPSDRFHTHTAVRAGEDIYTLANNANIVDLSEDKMTSYDLGGNNERVPNIFRIIDLRK